MKNLKLILRSLISNHACVEGGRKKPWYFAIPMVLLAMILALIPTFVQTITRQGDSIVSTNSYELDGSVERFLENIRNNNITMVVENKQLIVDEDKWNAVYTDKDASGNNCYIHYHTDAVSGNSFADLGVYYIPEVRLTDDVFQNITTFPDTTNVDEQGNPKRVNRNYSFVLFTEKRVWVYVYASGKSSGQSIGTITGDYENLPDGWSINSCLAEKSADTWENWKFFLRKAYDNNRVKLTWQTTLMMFGINAGITIFMGFMLWVLTRGKNNLRWFGLWETQKIVYWTTISPAILTTGLGFLISSFSQVMFPLLLGVRIMWLSMKLLRPENADVYPPLKETKTVDVKPVSDKHAKQDKEKRNKDDIIDVQSTDRVKK